MRKKETLPLILTLLLLLTLTACGGTGEPSPRHLHHQGSAELFGAVKHIPILDNTKRGLYVNSWGREKISLKKMYRHCKVQVHFL